MELSLAIDPDRSRVTSQKSIVTIVTSQDGQFNSKNYKVKCQEWKIKNDRYRVKW